MIRVRGWRGILVLVAVCSLTLSVATRYCASGDSPTGAGHSVKTRLVEPKVQRLVVARDGAQGLPQVGRVAIVAVSTYQPRIAVDVSPVLIADFDDAISNRAPPPSARLS